MFTGIGLKGEVEGVRLVCVNNNKSSIKLCYVDALWHFCVMMKVRMLL